MKSISIDVNWSIDNGNRRSSDDFYYCNNSSDHRFSIKSINWCQLYGFSHRLWMDWNSCIVNSASRFNLHSPVGIRAQHEKALQKMYTSGTLFRHGSRKPVWIRAWFYNDMGYHKGNFPLSMRRVLTRHFVRDFVTRVVSFAWSRQ